MRPIALRIAVLTLTLGLLGCHGGPGTGFHVTFGRQASEQFQWVGHVAEGQRLEIKGVKGKIDARAAEGDQVQVTVDRRGLRSDPDEVRIEVLEHEGGVTICAVYPGDNVCLPGDAGRLRAQRNDVKVDFDVRLPAGVTLAARTVDGQVDVTALDSNVEARTVNGAIRISTAGHARAETVNGSIHAELGRVDWDGEAAFETVNGSVTVTLPREIHATVRASTANGSISNDLPLDVTTSSRRRLEGTIGRGGRELHIETVNGSISISHAS